MLKNVATGCHFTGPLALRLRLSADLLRFYFLLTLYPFPVKKSMKILLLGMIYYLEIILPFQSLFYSIKETAKCGQKSDSLIYILYFRKLPLLFLLYSVFLPPTPGGLLRRTYQSSVPENQCTAQIQYSVA